MSITIQTVDLAMSRYTSFVHIHPNGAISGAVDSFYEDLDTTSRSFFDKGDHRPCQLCKQVTNTRCPSCYIDCAVSSGWEIRDITHAPDDIHFFLIR